MKGRDKLPEEGVRQQLRSGKSCGMGIVSRTCPRRRRSPSLWQKAKERHQGSDTRVRRSGNGRAGGSELAPEDVSYDRQHSLSDFSIELKRMQEGKQLVSTILDSVRVTDRQTRI